MKKCHTIVIGSGLGGLFAAALSVMAGKKVLVLEKHFKLGGYASSFWRESFKFDTALHQTGGVEKTYYKNILKECGIYNKLEFIKHEYLYESINYDTDFELKVKNGDPENLKRQLIKQFPKEKWGIRLWFSIIKKIGRETYRWDKAMANNKISQKIFLCFAPFLIPLLMFAHKISVQRVLSLCTKNKELQSALMQLKAYYGDNLNIACLLPFIGNYGYYFDGGYYVKGGGRSVTDALKTVIKENGGEILVRSGVEKIIVENDVAIGVKTKEQIYYGKKIIANASPFIVYGKLLKDWHGSEKELEKINKIKKGTCLSQAYLGLNCPVEKINKRFEKSYLVFINNLPDDFYKDIVLAFNSQVDKTAAPPKKSILCITFLDNYERWDLPEKEYEKKKAEELKKIYGLLQDYLPDLESCIEVSELATPKTMEKYTGNRGLVYGFPQDIGQAGPDRFKSESPLKNLYFSSAYVLGGGFEGTARGAKKVAQKILNSFNI